VQRGLRWLVDEQQQRQQQGRGRQRTEKERREGTRQNDGMKTMRDEEKEGKRRAKVGAAG
jgi:hypothetical protein